MRDATPALGTPALDLGVGERWALTQVRRHGVGPFIALMTTGAVLVSGTVVMLSLLVRGRLDDPGDWVPSLVLGTVIPMILAPPLLLVSARLVDRLDTASELLRASVVIDPLTGVANRRGFFAAIEAFDDDEEIEVAMADVDSFKQLNDRYGHAVGDAALRAVANWLVELVGDAGWVGRIGGDEFAFVAVADPSRTTPSRQRFELGDDVEFTLSIGRSVGPAAARASALLAADAELYEQKRSRPTVRSGPRRASGRVRTRDPQDEP